MSLLDCVCCPKHNYRTAVISDDLKTSSAETYGNVIERASRLACFIRQKLQKVSRQCKKDELLQDKMVALWAESCPEAVSGILGILSVPAVYMPMDLGQGPGLSGPDNRENGTERRLQQYGVRTALVHHSCIHEFMGGDWSNIRVTMDTALLEFGFICANFDYMLPSPITLSPPPSLPPSTPDHLCTSTKMCQHCHILCSRTSNNQSLHYLSTDLIGAYYRDIQEASHCSVCDRHSPTGNQTDWGCAIYSSGHPIAAINSNTDNWNFPTLCPMSLAYVMHTSGTTGRPKPVRVPHCCIVPNIVDLTQRFFICPDDCVFNAAPLTFDPSIVEIFLSLCNGAALLTVSRQVKRSPRALASVLFVRNHTTVLQITPSLFHRFPDEEKKTRLLGDQSRVRILAFGGEKFPPLRPLAKYKTTTNLTKIFNIYGTTEVSSWSTCQAVSEAVLCRSLAEGSEGNRNGGSRQEGKIEEGGVAIGERLLGTKVEVRGELSKEDGRFGEIYLGGGYRVCLLGDEICPSPNTLRGTGDWGWVSKEGVVYFAGRLDRQVKRWGHRVNLEQIEECIQSHPSVSGCAVTTLPTGHFLRHIERDSSQPETRLAAFTVPTPHHSTTASLWIDELMSDLVHSLPGHFIPDVIIPVHYLPCNQHGKVDVNCLLRFEEDPSLYLTPLPAGLPQPLPTTELVNKSVSIFQTSSEELRPGTGTMVPPDIHAVQDGLLSLITRFTCFSNWLPDLTLLELGASSFDVIRIADAVKLQFRQHCLLPQLTDILLSRKMKEVVNYVWTELSGGEGRRGEVCVSGDERKGGEVCDSGDEGRGGEVHASIGKQEVRFSQLCKRKREWGEEAPTAKRVPSSHVSIHAFRRGQAFVNGELSLTALCVQSEDTDTKSRTRKVCMSIKWSFNTGRCVDASPLVVREGLAPPTVFIGSHSGIFVSLSVHSGEKRWQTQLSDRIESTACLSLCGGYVIVGCYDGSVYCLQSDSGVVRWTLQLSHEPVKSSACVDVTNGLIWIGSHDHHLYAIDIEGGCVVHKVLLGGGACFSSPCIDPRRGLVYAATLQGKVAAVDKTEGCVLWTYSCGDKPVFSSPSLLPGGEVAVGCVDGSAHIISPDGEKVKLLRTGQPIFSSSSIALLYFSQRCDRDALIPLTQLNSWTASNQTVKDSVVNEEMNGVGQEESREKGSCEYSVRVLCGSHDKCVYCWNGMDGQQLWRAVLDSEVYSTPVACTLPYNATFSKDIRRSQPLKVSGTRHDIEPCSTLVPVLSCNVSATSSPLLGCVCVCTTSGQVYLLDVHTGEVLGSVRLPGEVFSSPVVVDSHILIGCRDDCIYCIECVT